MRKLAWFLMIAITLLALPILPLDSVSAASGFQSIGEILGYENVAVQREYDLTTSIKGQDSNMVTDQITYSEENGLSLNGGYARLIQRDNWSPISDGKIAYFKAKVADTSSFLQVLWLGPGGAPARASVILKADSISQAEGALTLNNAFAPGTDWVEYVIVADSQDTWSFYVKNSTTNNQWLLTTQGKYGTNGGTGTGLYFTGHGHIKNAIIYEKGKPLYDNPDQIMGKTLYEEKSFDLTNTDYKSESGFIFVPTGEHTEENGAPINQDLGGNGFWRYYAGIENWSPLTPGSRAAYFQAKADEGQLLQVLVQSPGGGNAYGSFTISPTAFGEIDFTNLDYARSGGAGTDFVEYLLVAESETTIHLYAKGLTNDDKWTLVATGSGYAKTDNGSIGLYFAGNGYVKNVALYCTDDAFVSQHLFHIDSNFDTNLDGVITTGTVHYSDDKGLTISADSEWKFLPESGWSGLANGQTFSFRAMIPSSSSLNVQVAAPNTNLRRKVYIDISPSAVYVVGNSSHTGFGAPTPEFSFVPGTGWVDYRIKANGNNSYSVYILIDGVWTLYAKTEGYTDAGAASTVGLKFYASGGDVFIQDIQTLNPLGVNDSFAKSDTETQAYYTEDFTEAPTHKNCSTNGTVTFQDGWMNLTNQSSFSLTQSGIPTNGYAEFKLKSDSAPTELTFYDGARALTLTFAGIFVSANGTRTLVADSGNVPRTWRIVKNNDGTFDGYFKTLEEHSWYPAFRSVAGNASSEEMGIHITQSPHDNGDAGKSSLSYLRLYGPSTGNPLVLTDGINTQVISENGKVRNADSVCAVVEPDSETDRKLIMMEYNEAGEIIGDTVYQIPMGQEPYRTVHSVKSDENAVWKLKAFLWDAEHKPLQNPQTIRSGKILWNEDGWAYGGTTQTEDGVILISSSDNNVSYAETEVAIGSSFDLSWTMALNRTTGTNRVVLSSGSVSTTLDITSTGVSFGTSSGTKAISHPIGTDKQTYRIVGIGNNWDLYIGGTLVADMDSLVSDSGSPEIRFETRGTDSAMSIYGVSTSSYDSYFNPTYTQSFDNGDMTGWTQYPVTPVTNGPSYEVWSCEDGMLKLQNPSYLSGNIRKTITTGDDFVFESRICFQNFANWFGLSIYVNNHYLNMEMRHEYFTLVTPVKDPTTTNFQTAYSDKLEIDPEKWYVLKIESYNNSDKVRVFLDDKLIMEEEMADYPGNPNKLIEFYGYGCHVDDCTVQVDWVRYLTREAQIEDQVPMPSRNASATLNATWSDNSITASLGNMTSFETVASVSYWLDGKEVAASSTSPYAVTIPDVTPENHMLEAVGKTAGGMVVARTSTELTAENQTSSTNYSNEISYTASGEGVAAFSNGNHKVQMHHSDASVTYLTDTGEETYEYGAGDFHIITDGPIAEVYYNGQFAFSYYMPRTDEIGSSFTGSISGTSVSTTPERKNYFVARTVTEKNVVHNLADFPCDYNLDFIAGADDTAFLSVNDGYYRTDVSIENGKLYVWDAAKKHDQVEKTLVENVTEDAYYRVETSGGMTRVYKNGRWISTFRGSRSVGPATLAVQVSSGVLDYLSVNDCTDVYLYQDDFSGNGEISASDFWRSSGITPEFTGGDMVLNATGKTNAFTELYAYSGDFDLSAKVTVSSFGTWSSGGFWFLLNHTETDTYTKVGYTHNTFLSNKYEIVDRVNAADVSGGASKNGSLPQNQEVQLDLKVRRTEDGEMISLSVNGQEVLNNVGHFERYGKIGFILSNCVAKIHEVSYRGNARPIPGVNEKIFDSNGMRDLMELDNGDLYIINHVTGLKTNDGGETWEEVASKLVFKKDAQGNDTTVVDTENTIGITSSRNYGWSNHILRLQNGTYLSVVPRAPQRTEYNKLMMDFTVAQSTDGMHWTDVITSNPPYYERRLGVGPTVNALKQGASGRVYYTYHDGSSEDVGDVMVWYSDDNGKNWKHSITINGEDVGHVLAESQVVESETSTKLFFRNDKGYLCYYESPDCGTTWDLEHLYKTPLIASTACFNIEQDPTDPNTVYVTWEYNNINLFGRPQWPRTRWGVAKSTDGGDTWEFVGTINENNHVSYTSSNMSMNVSNEYVIVNSDSLDDETGSETWRGRYMIFPKDTAKTSKRFEQLHHQYDGQVDNTRVIPEDRLIRTLVIHPESGRVLLHGERVENGATIDGYLALDIAEAFLGGSIILGETALTTVDGKQYVDLNTFADVYGLAIAKDSGIWIVSEKGDWGDHQIFALRNSVDLFAN